MIIDPSVLPFLTGREFSNGLQVRLSGMSSPCLSRIEELVELCDSKRVLHIGFTDHLPLIADKIKRRVWLHSLLLERAKKCVGLDVNREALEYCINTLQLPDIYYHNILIDPPLPTVADSTWDIAILGEVVEHLSDPVAFLTALRVKYGKKIKKIAISVPNALDLSNFLLARHSLECINTDHRFWFTPFTLAKIAHDAGFMPEEFRYAHTFCSERWVYRHLRRRYPMLRETLIGVFHPIN
jgi:hypothetical protein